MVEHYQEYLVISYMNILIGIIAVSVIIFILGIGTFLGGQELNTSCRGEESCAICGDDSSQCENR